MKLKIILFIVINWIAVSSISAQDPGLPGPFETAAQIYNFGDQVWNHPTISAAAEIRGVVHHPVDLAQGDFPVLLFLHGRHAPCFNETDGLNFAYPCPQGEEIPSFLGYDFLAEHMASHGYIVISIGANGINAVDGTSPDFGISARAALIQTHLDIWNEWNVSDTGPFGGQFIGKLNLQNIGTMGHSRGGEGIMTHVLLNEQLGNPYQVKAALAVAPTNIFRNKPFNTNVGVMLGYCDGDLADLPGIHYFDDTRYQTTNGNYSRHEVLLMGANHNYFNLNWSDGQFGGSDDWAMLDTSQMDDFCGINNPNNKRLSQDEQRAAFITYASAFFRKYVGGEDDFDAIVMSEELTPPTSSGLDSNDVHISFHPPVNDILQINTGQIEENRNTNDLLNVVNTQNLISNEICGDNLLERFCLNVFPPQQPHNNNALVYELGLSQIRLRWDENMGWYENELGSFGNISEYKALQFRAGVDFTNLSSNTELDFGVMLIDGNGVEQQLDVENYSNALFYPPGNVQFYLPKLTHNTIRIPLEDFDQVDLNNITSIRFAFNQNTEGAVLISDVILTGKNTADLAPIADFEAVLIHTCTGFVPFIDLSKHAPNSWSWDFGDGNISNEQNPVHFYEKSGIYSVTLEAGNDNGNGIRERAAYIVVEKPMAPVVVDDQRCTPGVVELNATSNFNGELVWFDTLSEGVPVNIGNNFTPDLDETTKFYVQESVPFVTDTAGISVVGAGQVNNFDVKTIFEVHQNCFLRSVRIEAASTDNRTIALYNENGLIIQTVTIAPVGGPEVVTLNFPLLSGQTYALGIINSPINLFTDFEGNYPYHAGNLATIVGHDIPIPGYFYFYDWIFEGETCTSELAVVNGIIENIELEPILVQNNDELEVTNLDFANIAQYQWLLNGDTIVGATESTYLPPEDGTYTVIVTDTEGCTGSDTVEVISTNTDDLQEEDNIFIHPNPFSNSINIRTSSRENGTVKMYNNLGVLVAEKELSQQENTIMSVGYLNAGSYYIYVYWENGSSTVKKVIKL